MSIKKLTWHPSLPAPFESGKSIFRKILVLNHMKMEELSRLIRKQGHPVKPVKTINDLNSDWIDFERFAKLLGIKPIRLRQGFLDQLGFATDARLPRSEKVTDAIRQCPRCADYGYHCVFFDLAIITECPWHHVPLRVSAHGCAFCLRPRSESDRKPLGGICHICGGTSLRKAVELCFKRFDKTATRMRRDFGNELVQWRRSIHRATPVCQDLIGDLDLTGVINQASLGFISWQLGHVLSFAHDLNHWKFQISPTSVKHMVLTDESCADMNHPKAYINDDDGKKYRSIRRNIYNRYVRQHRACLIKLRALTRDESLCLNGDNVCPVALAYVVWRMSIEGIGNIEGVHFPRKTNYLLRLMSPDLMHTTLFRLRWSYFAFFGLWHQFDRRCGRQNLSVHFDKFGECTGYLWSSSIATSKKNSLRKTYNFLYPDLKSSYQHLQKCKSQISNPLLHQPSLVKSLKCGWRLAESRYDDMFRIYFSGSKSQPNDFCFLHV